MHYRQLRFSRPPPIFELRVNSSLARMASQMTVPLLPQHLTNRLRDYLESMLLAENFPPTPHYIAMLLDSFLQLIKLGQDGKPFIYKKRNSISLLFDISALQSEMTLDAPDELVLGYTQTMMGFLLFKPDPKKIGMVGLGGGSLTKFCYRHLSEATISVAEIDAGVIALRDQFHIPKDDDRLQVKCMDGKDFVRQADNQFDVLLVDGFDVKGQPPQLCSQHFYDDCFQALAPGGVMVVNLLGDVAETRIYIDRLHTAFCDAVIVIDALDSLNKIAFACKGEVPRLDNYTLKHRIGQLESKHSVILSLTAQSILLARRAEELPMQQNLLDTS